MINTFQPNESVVIIVAAETCIDSVWRTTYVRNIRTTYVQSHKQASSLTDNENNNNNDDVRMRARARAYNCHLSDDDKK